MKSTASERAAGAAQRKAGLSAGVTFALCLERSPVRRTVPAIVLAVAYLFHQPAPIGASEGRQEATSAPSPRDESPSQLMADRIDQLLGQQAAREGIEFRGPASDGEFLRRICLDLTGVIPTVSQVRDFLNDESPGKRALLIDHLLAHPSYALHMASVWRDLMLPTDASIDQLGGAAGLQRWLRRQFSDNLRYDRIVSDLIATTGGNGETPALYFTAQGLDAKKLAANSARIFLGVQIQCAECHDHPFDRWTQRDFWGYAAFFARLSDANSQRLIDQPSGEVTLPDSKEVVLPRYPGGGAVEELYGGTRRQQLSIWMASPENPYLARAAVNRVWSILFGRGLVNPVDDLGPHNPASHPELLEELSAYFVANGYDLRDLFRTIANSQAYQRSSQVVRDKAVPIDAFASMPLKVLTAEQLYDSLSRCLMTGGMAERPLSLPGREDPQRQRFLATMRANTRDATEYQAGLQQALTMMNGGEVSAATSLTSSSLLTALEAPFFTDAQRLNILFLATVSRVPTVDELRLFAEHRQLLDSRGDVTATADASVVENPAHGNTLQESIADRQALADLLWALLNSAEFALNH